MKYYSNNTGYKKPKTTEQFKQDLAEANALENQLKALLEDYWKCTVTTSQDKGSFSGWDLKVEFKDPTEPPLTIEVKQDKRCMQTGNVAVEIGRELKNGWRDTCLSATESDVYAYYFNNQYHLIDTPILKQLVEQQKYKRLTKGGDANRALCALFDRELFLQYVEITLKPPL